MSDQLTAADVLYLIRERAQWCRENGESDMRIILNTVRSIESDIVSGKPRDEILTSYADEGDAE